MEADLNQSSKNINLKESMYGTQIAVPGGQKSIEKFKIGDSVLAFSAKLESGSIKVTSSEAKVFFSGGAESSSSTFFVIIMDVGKEIICSSSQPFLLINGKFTTARSLRPGVDKLVDKDGKPVEIKMIKSMQFRNGVHAIAVNDNQTENSDGHLLLAQGVIIGDYFFQTHFNPLTDYLKEKA